MLIHYVKHPVTDVYALEEGLAGIGRVKDVPWLIHQIEALGEAEMLRRFIAWPVPGAQAGTWGAIFVDPYMIMCHIYMPSAPEHAMGAQMLVEVDRASTREDIRRRLRELG